MGGDTNVTVAELLRRYLRLEGVDHVFGVPGGALQHVLNALALADAPTYVICRQETGAAYAADGYARAGGGLGVVVVTSGPGATNALTGAVNAQSSGSPLLVVTGEVAQQYFGRHYLQEGVDADLDVDQVYANAVRSSAMVTSPVNLAQLLEEALRDALTPPRYAAHISLPTDVAGTPVDPAILPRSPGRYRPVNAPRPPPDAVTQVLEVLADAERPLLYIGNGSRAALADVSRLQRFSRFVEEWGLAVTTTPDGKGLFPETHDLSLRTFGLAGSMWSTTYVTAGRLDALLVIGSGLGELATGMWQPHLVPDGPLVQVDIVPSALGRGFPLDLGVVADAGAFLDELLAGAEHRGAPRQAAARRRLVAAAKAGSPFARPDRYAGEDGALYPEALMRTVQEVIAGERGSVWVDAGNCVGWGLHYLAIDPPDDFHAALAMGPMGFAVAAIVGAKLARPDTLTIGIVGDGAFLMHGSEVSTAARYDAGAVWVVLADDELNMVVQGQQEFFPDLDVDWAADYALGGPDLAGFARSLGAEAYEAFEPGEAGEALRSAVQGARSGRPQVVIAHVEPAAVPPYYPEDRQPKSTAAP